MIKEMYEGDTLTLDLDLSSYNIPDNPNLTFIIDLGELGHLKKQVGLDGVVLLTEQETVGLDGIYPCELRLNNSGKTKVYWQKYISIKNSITVDSDYKGYEIINSKYVEIIERIQSLETDDNSVTAITLDEIDKLF